MQKRHQDRVQYFKEQGLTTENYVIPYIEKSTDINSNTRVLEIGCGEGGNLIPFVNRNCDVVGIDISKYRIDLARQYIENICPGKKVQLIHRDIYKIEENEIGQFDVIFLRDVIEHLPNQDKFMPFVKSFLKPGGLIFFGFPPWRMPFGGHQQICKSKLLSKTPFFHLLPRSIYRIVLNIFGENEGTIKEMLELKNTGISINRFEKLAHHSGYSFVQKDLYFINPNYQTKFGLKPRLLWKSMSMIPYIRDFFTTCYYCLIGEKSTP